MYRGVFLYTSYKKGMIDVIKSIYVSGYRPHELGIFTNSHPGLPIIKRAITERLEQLLEAGLEWVIISGQPGVETWTAEVVIELKKEYEQLKLAIITPFLNMEENWKDDKKQTYHYICSEADFVSAASKKPYEAPWQFVEKDKFILENTEGLLLVYDEENEASPKYLLRLARQYQEHVEDYELLMINAYDLQMIAEDIQQSEWDDFY